MKAGVSKYPFFELKHGDSFLVTSSLSGVRALVRDKRKKTGINFISRMQRGSLRIWRVDQWAEYHPLNLPIEKGIPLPSRGESIKGKNCKWPFHQMEVGDSFFFETEDKKIAPAVSRAGSRNGKKFTLRKENNGVRIWRLA